MVICMDKRGKKMKIDNDYIISVKELMSKTILPRPKHRSTYLYNDGEFLPIITVECEV